MTELIELRGVSMVYGSNILGTDQTRALDGVSIGIPSDIPSMIAVAGESGSGKTTMVRLLLGFITPTAGQVLYRGVDVARMSRTQRREFRREVQPIFQDPFEVFNPFYRVDHVLTMPLRRHGLARSSLDARRQVQEALEMVGLRPHETLGRFLSGGQRQRIMVARALLLRPKLIIADEPVSMVDASLRATILGSLQSMNRDLGISVIYVTHDLATAFQICSGIVVMYQGSIAEAGTVERVIGAPKHPYTQLLVESIPLPTVERTWVQDDQPSGASADRPVNGCKFAPRCPAVMDGCWVQTPPLYLPDADRTAACFLYRDQPTVDPSDVGRLLRAPNGDGSRSMPEEALA